MRSGYMDLAFLGSYNWPKLLPNPNVLRGHEKRDYIRSGNKPGETNFKSTTRAAWSQT